MGELADKQNAYRYRLSVSADKKGHIGWVTDILLIKYVF